MYASVCGAMVCANLGFHCTHSVSLLLLLQATRSQSIWKRLEELQVNILIQTNIFSHASNLSFTSWHCLLKSWSIVHGYLLSTYSCGIRVLSAMGSRGGVDYIVSPFQNTITGVVVWGFRSSFLAVACEGYLVESRRPLWFRSSQANLVLSGFNTLSTSCWRQCHTAR